MIFTVISCVGKEKRTNAKFNFGENNSGLEFILFWGGGVRPLFYTDNTVTMAGILLPILCVDPTRLVLKIIANPIDGNILRSIH